jgi:hypothetical protein
MTTSQDLHDRPEAQLAYPSSAMLYEQSADEEEGHGFDNLDRAAMIDRWYRAAADGAAILAWYAHQLDDLGWSKTAFSAGAEMLTFTRGSERLSVVITTTGPGMWSPTGTGTGTGSETGTVYRVCFRAGPRAVRES